MWEFRLLGSRPDPVRLGAGRCSVRSKSTEQDCENKVGQLKEKIEKLLCEEEAAGLPVENEEMSPEDMEAAIEAELGGRRR